MESKKSKLGLGIFIGVLIGLIIGLTGFIVYDKVVDKDNDDIKLNDVNKNDNNDSNKTIDNASNNNSSINDDFDISKFDNTKEAINGNKNIAYKLTDNDASKVGLSANLNSNKKSAIISIDWSKYFEIYGISLTDGKIRKYNITNFTKSIKEVYVGGFSQTSGYETAFYVMEDGTVEFTPIKHSLGNNGSSNDTVLKSYGAIKNVSGVVKIVTATDYSLDSNSYMGGSYNILGVKSDGTFYDISKILMESYSDYYSFN